MTTADAGVERASRWMAARMTRRSFVGRVAELAVLVAGGPTLVGLLARRAEARVCGQSGVSPKCPTYDFCAGPNRVWGWCWYASPGCCAGGGLKKICDCCTLNYPNVHGYCPSGHNVECIVESCFADPRVMTVPVERLPFTAPVDSAAAVSRARYLGRRGTVVIGDGERGPVAALAATVAAAEGGAPFLLTARSGLSSVTRAEVQRLGAEHAVLVGPSLSPNVRASLEHMGLKVDTVGEGDDLSSFSLSVARFVIGRTHAHRAIAVSTLGVGGTVLGAAAAAAAAKRYPLVLGLRAAKALASSRPSHPVLTYMLGPEMAPHAGELPGGHPVEGNTRADLARQLASIMTDVERLAGISLTVLPKNLSGFAFAGARGLFLFHDYGVLDFPNAQWIRAHQPFFARGWVAGTSGSLGTQGLYDIQSALNHYDSNRLIGVSGQGLPVISQPDAERPIGRARIAGAPPQEENGGYWVSRANPDR